MLRQIRPRVRVKATLMAPLLGLALFVALLASMAAPVAQAATTSSTLNFQARLLNSAGGIVPDGNYNIDFKIYNADSTTGSVGTCTGACVWEETRTNAGGHGIPVINGYFSVNLGSVTAFGSGINWDQQLWLTMNIGGTSGGGVTWDGEMQNSGHSIALTALPYAFTAGQLALTSGAHRGTLSFNTVANDPNILLPDASGTICLQTSSACGFETTTGTDFIQNQNASPQTANFNITGTGVIGTSLQVPLVQTADSAAGNTTAITLRSGNETGSSLSSGSVTIKSGDASGGTNSSSGSITIDSGSKSGSGTTGSISIGTTNASAVSIGSSTTALTLTGSSSSNIVFNGVTISAAELNLLDGHGDSGSTLVDTNDAVTTAITGTGALNSGSITSGFGTIDTGADNITTTGTVNGNTIDRSTSGTLSVGTGQASAITLGGASTVTTAAGGLTVTTGKNLTVNADVFTDLTGTGITDISNALSIDQSASLTWTGTEAFNGATSFTPSSTNNVTFTGDNDSNVQVASTLSSDVTQTGLALSLTDNASASTGTVYGLSVTNADNGANTGVPDALAYFKNANAAETVPAGVLVEQTGAGTLTSGLEVKQTAGAITNGLTFTGTFSKLINSTNFSVTNAGAVTATSLDAGSGTIQTTGTVNGNTIDREASGTLSIGTGQASAITLGGASTVTTAAGGLTVTTGKNFTVNADVFTDLTGTGIADISSALSIDQSASLTWTGLEAINNNNAAGFKVSDSSSSKTVLTVDTSGDTVILGNSGASGITGKLKFNFAGQTGSITLDATNPSSTGYTIHLPAENGTLCIQSSTNCGFIAGSGTAFIQSGNSFGATGTLGTTDANGLNIITNSHIVLGLSSTGAATFENFSDSATGFQIQTSTASALLNVNTTDGYVINNGVGNLGNEIQNPGFESSGTTDATGWYAPSASQVITNNSANAHSGNYELQVTGNSSTHAVTTKLYAVHPGDTIYTEAWVKNSAGATGDAGMYIEFDDKDKASTTFSNADTGLPGTSYVKKSITTTVPAGSFFVRIAASVKSTATTGTFYFDDFYLKKVNEQAPVLFTNTSATAFQVQNSSAVTVLGVDATSGKIFSNLADGGSSVGFALNTTNTYSTAGAKLLSVQNNGAEKFSVDKDGNVNIPSTKFYEVGGSQIATTNLSDGAQVALKNAANTFSNTNSFQVTNTNGFQVQDAAGSHTYIQADTNGGTLYLGNTQTGSTVQIGNSTGAAVTQTINIGSTNTTASSASTITIGSTIGGSLTLQPGGGIIVAAGALGTADNTSYLCRNSSSKLAGCITTGTGVAYVNGGNTLGSLSGNLATIGTNDANSLQIKTNNVGRATFDTSNNLYLGNADATGVNTAPNNFNVKGTGSSTTGTAGGDVNLYGGAGNSTSTGSAGGNVSINGGAAGGTGNNAGGNITLVAGLNTGSGVAGGVTVKNAANSTAAFQVQDTGSAAVFSVSTSTPTVTVSGGTVFTSNTYTSGANSTITQSLVDNNTTISATATATSLTFTVPAPTTATTGRLLYIGNGGSNSFVLNIGSVSYTLAPGSSSTLIYIGSGWTDAGIDASTLQLGYSNSVGSMTPEIKLDTTRSTLNIQDADSSVGADILDVNASNAGGGGLGTVVFGVGATGATKVHTTGTGSTTAFIVQNANSNNFIAVDTTSGGNSVSLDSDTGSAGTIKIGNIGGHAQTVNIGLTASNSSNSTINIATNANASATNAISIGSNGNAANGVTIEAGNTGGINLGNTDVAHTFNIGNGGSSTTQTVNIGSNSGSSVVSLKSNAGISLKTNSSTNNGTVVQSVSTNSTAAFQVQNTSNNSLMSVDTSGNIITLGSTAQALNGTQGIKVYGANSTSSAIDLLTPTDSSGNSLFYGANNSRAQFGYNGTNSNASIKAASSVGFELMTNGASTATFTASTNGNILFKNYSDSASAFQVQNQNSRLMLGVDNTNSVVNVGNDTDGSQISFNATGNVSSVIRKSMIVNGTIAANDLVQLDTSNAGQAKQAVASSTNVFGVATSAVGSGGEQDIVISGIYQVNGNASNGTIAVGDTLVSSSTAGQVAKAGTTTTSGSVVGIATSLLSGGKVWVFINLGLGGSDNLQTVYNKSTGGASSTPTIKISSGVGGINIQDADTTVSGSLLTIRQSSVGSLGTAILDVQSNGTIATGQTTLTLFNTTATTVNALQAATSISLGATTGTLSLRNSNLTIGNAAGSGTFTNNGATLNTTLALGDLAAGSIGTNSTTVDIYTSFSIAPTASARAYTLPTPTASTAYGRAIYISNIASAGNYFTISGIRIPPGSTGTLIWSNTNGGASWQFAGAGGASIENQNSADQTATFRIAGSGTINVLSATAFQVQNGSGAAVFTVDTTDGIIQVGSSASNTATTILALNSNDGTTTPTEVDGGMYYNNSTGQFLCGENGFWVSCGVPPRDHSYDLYDEFMDGNSGSLAQGAYGIGGLNWFNSLISAPIGLTYNNNPAAGGNTPTADVNRPGIMNIEQTGTGNNTGQTTSLGIASIKLGTSRIDYKTAVNITAPQSTVLVGLHNETTATTAPTTGVYWKEAGAGTWQYCYVNGSNAETCANSAVTATAGTWARLEIIVVSSTEVDYYINGTKIAATGITYNTTNKVAPAYSSYKTSGSPTAQDIYIDYFELLGTTTTAR